MFRLLCLLLTLLVCGEGALARPRTYRVATLQDANGHSNGHSGPGFNFLIRRRIPGGEHFLVSDWPAGRDLRSPQLRSSLTSLGCDPQTLSGWLYVLFLEAQPDKPEPQADWAYLHKSKSRIVRTDALTWAYIQPKQEVVALRQHADSRSPQIGQLNALESFFVLDQPAYAGQAGLTCRSAVASQPWTRVMTRAGKVGFVLSAHVEALEMESIRGKGALPSVQLKK